MPLEEKDYSDGPSFNEAIYGKEMADAEVRLKACLSEVEARHQAYFDSLTAEAPEQDRPVRLHNFHILQWDAHHITFSILPGLREDIADECRACADSAFKR